MKKTSKILLLISGIVGIIFAVYALFAELLASFMVGLFGFILLGMGVMSLLISNGVFSFGESVDIIFTGGGEESLFVYFFEGGIMSATAIILSIVAIVGFIALLVMSIIALISRKKEKKGLYIANFVIAGILLFVLTSFSSISLIPCILSILGSIFGLIALNKDKEQQMMEEEGNETIEPEDYVD